MMSLKNGDTKPATLFKNTRRAAKHECATRMNSATVSLSSCSASALASVVLSKAGTATLMTETMRAPKIFANDASESAADARSVMAGASSCAMTAGTTVNIGLTASAAPLNRRAAASKAMSAACDVVAFFDLTNVDNSSMSATPAAVSATSSTSSSALAFCNRSVTSASALRRTRPSL